MNVILIATVGQNEAEMFRKPGTEPPEIITPGFLIIIVHPV